jgi:hypothetical protein
MQCSNPDCRAYTSGPQTNAEKAVNVGVGAHITAASSGGPRFDSSLSEKERRSASNGIWLCQTCAKLVDSDTQRYSSQTLLDWKTKAEREAGSRIGKTNRVSGARLVAKAEEILRRDHKVRDELKRAFLRSNSDRLASPVNSAQYRKFAVTEFIVHRMDDTSYPHVDSAPGISGWLKFEVFDFYFNGIEVILDIEYVLLTEYAKSWSRLPEEQKKEAFPAGFWPAKVFKIGKFPGAIFGITT